LPARFRTETEIPQNTPRHPVTFQDQAEQDMFSSDASMLGDFGLRRCKPERFLDTRSVWKPARYFAGWKSTDPILDLPSYAFTIHSHFFKNIRNNSVFQGQQAEQDVFRADKTVIKAGGFLPGQFQCPPGARGKCAWNWNKSPGHNDLEFRYPRPLFSAEFCEFVFEQAGLANALHGALKCLLLAFSRLHPPSPILAQMTFQFVHDVWIPDAGGQHLPPPFRDGLFEIKHVVLSINRRGRKKSLSIVRAYS